MPRYFFDTRDNDTFIPDPTGREMEGLDAAKDEVSRALRAMVRDIIPDGERGEFTTSVKAVTVRDETRRTVLRATLSLMVEGCSDALNSTSDASRPPVLQALDQANQVIEQSRAEIARSQALGQSVADLAHQLDRITEQSGAS